VKVRCRTCNRWQDVDVEVGRTFVMPAHENYTKTEPCPASGQACVIDGAAAFPTNGRSMRLPIGIDHLALIAMAVCGRRRR